MRCNVQCIGEQPLHIGSATKSKRLEYTTMDSTQIIDRIVARNNALWTLLNDGDNLGRDENLALIERAFGDADDEEVRS
jgi:hypothetical protein